MKVFALIFFLSINFACFDCHTCGTQKYQTFFSVGGEEAANGEFPWKVALFYGKKYFCGGSIIGKNHVLTAAHCFFKTNGQMGKKENVQVVVGRHNISDPTEVHSVSRSVIDIILTKTYIHPSAEGDAAILKLNESLEFNDFVMPICLPRVNTNVYNIIGTIVGYGKSENLDKEHEVLPSFIEIESITQSECYKNHERFFNLISDNTFCAGGKGKSPCRGDSGGGFIVKDNLSKQWTIYGIVSLGLHTHNGCNAENPVLFTSVHKFIDWIQEFVLDASFASGTSNHKIYGNVENEGYWPFRKKVFILNKSAIIDNTDYIIESPKNLEVKSLKTKDNKNCEYLPVEVASNFPNLVTYKIKRCAVKKIANNNFNNLAKLEDLILCENKILSIGENSFDSLVELRTLDLSNNRIKSLDENLFKKCKKLEEILLTSNQLISLNENHFSENRNLRVIKLDENQISKLAEMTFESLKKLRLLDLVANACIDAYFAENDVNNVKRQISMYCKE